MSLSKDIGERLKKQIDILISGEEYDPEIIDAHKKIFVRIAKEFSGYVEEKKVVTPANYVQALLKPQDPFEYPVNDNVVTTHMINYHCGMYHWMSDIRSRSLIKLRQDFEVEVRSRVMGQRMQIGFCLKENIKWVQLSLFDIGVELPDGKGKYLTVKVKLVKMQDLVKPAIFVEQEEEEA